MQQLQIAAASIGWTAKSVVFNGALEDMSAEAVRKKLDAIKVSGGPVAVSRLRSQPRLPPIVVGLNSISTNRRPSRGHASLTNGGLTSKQIGELHTYMSLRDSGCKASAAIFNLPFSILKVVTAAVKADCPTAASATTRSRADQ